MPDDIYSKSPIVTPSSEHILLNALGGRLENRFLIDKTTNSVFGSTIDAELAEFLSPFRTLLNAPSGDGSPPPPYRGAKTEVGERFNLLPGGVPELAQPRVSFTQTPDGRHVISGSVRSMEELKRFTAKKLEKIGIPYEKLEQAAKDVQRHIPTVQMKAEFGVEAKRSLVKMVCNLMAHSQRSLFEKSNFDSVRKFVYLGDGIPDEFVVVNIDHIDIACRDTAFGLYDHLLHVRGKASTGEITGVVVVFGYLQFVIRIGNAKFDKSFVTSYRVNSIHSRHRFDSREDRGVNSRDFNRLSVVSETVRHTAMRSAVSRIMKFAMKKMNDEWQEEMFRKSWEETIGPPDGRPILPEDKKKFLRLLATRWVAYMQHRGVV